jgi:lipid-binding SYLF domain-containing protein
MPPRKSCARAPPRRARYINGKEPQAMMHNFKSRMSVFAVLTSLAAASAAWAQQEELVSTAQATVEVFKKDDPSMAQLFQSAAGYAIFPQVKKGAVIVGGAGGDGVLFERGKPVGKVSLSQVSVGVQAGAQTYSEVVFLANEAAVSDFKAGKSKLGAHMSAVAAKAGASTHAKYVNGIEVFTAAEGGLMVEAAVGGQTFKFEPFTNKAPGT